MRGVAAVRILVAFPCLWVYVGMVGDKYYFMFGLACCMAVRGDNADWLYLAYFVYFAVVVSYKSALRSYCLNYY